MKVQADGWWGYPLEAAANRTPPPNFPRQLGSWKIPKIPAAAPALQPEVPPPAPAPAPQVPAPQVPVPPTALQRRNKKNKQKKLLRKEQLIRNGTWIDRKLERL